MCHDYLQLKFALGSGQSIQLPSRLLLAPFFLTHTVHIQLPLGQSAPYLMGLKRINPLNHIHVDP